MEPIGRVDKSKVIDAVLKESASKIHNQFIGLYIIKTVWDKIEDDDLHVSKLTRILIKLIPVYNEISKDFDNEPDNIHAALSIGIKAILFDNLCQLKEALLAFDVKFDLKSEDKLAIPYH